MDFNSSIFKGSLNFIETSNKTVLIIQNEALTINVVFMYFVFCVILHSIARKHIIDTI